MTLEILLVLLFLGAAMALFVLEWVGVDVVTLLLLCALVVSGILTPEQAFSGFGSEILIVLGAVFVLSGALVRTGVMDGVARGLQRVAAGGPRRIVGVMMSISAGLSAFLNNTNTTAVLMPAGVELSRRGVIPRSRLLMPLAFASILGGTCTLIGTSTNIAASGLVERLGLEPYTLFEFTPVGVAAVGAGILYMTWIGFRALPDTGDADLGERYAIEEYLSALLVPETSALVGQRLADAPLSQLGLTVLAVVRGGHRSAPRPNSRLEAQDLLIVHASREALLRAKESPDLHLEADAHLAAEQLRQEVTLTEAFVVPSSQLCGRTVRELEFRRRFGVSLLAVFRRGNRLATDIRNLALRAGDVLLLQGEADVVGSLQASQDLWILGEVPHVPYRARKGAIAVGALVAAVVLGSTQVLPLSVALLLGALAVIVLGCITPQEVYGIIDWRLLILIAGMTSFGLAMQETGAADWLADLVVGAVRPLGLHAVLGTLALLTMVLTQPLSNAAAAMVVLPVAVSTAVQLDANPRTFAVMVTLAASLSFLTPFEPACLLVYGPGGYRFRDFVKAGVVLTLIAFVLLMLLVPLLWPL